MSAQKTRPAFELVLERVIDAPRERVFEAWTKPEQMAQWFAPKPFQLVIHTMDFRPGGRFSMAMRGPDGSGGRIARSPYPPNSPGPASSQVAPPTRSQRW